MNRRTLVALAFGAAHLDVCTALAFQESQTPDDSVEEETDR
ncbi:hypothetical protein [Aeromicrobium sp. 9AM]|nr:hypothetical protein [Aeromicrobium sp. 9AM]VXB15404.1 exported hypothetical protein [Aeromicrobium sp. 9AM]